MHVFIDPEHFIEDARAVFKKAAKNFTKTLTMARASDVESIGDESDKVKEGTLWFDVDIITDTVNCLLYFMYIDQFI